MGTKAYEKTNHIFVYLNLLSISYQPINFLFFLSFPLLSWKVLLGNPVPVNLAIKYGCCRLFYFIF